MSVYSYLDLICHDIFNTQHYVWFTLGVNRFLFRRCVNIYFISEIPLEIPLIKLVLSHWSMYCDDRTLTPILQSERPYGPAKEQIKELIPYLCICHWLMPNRKCKQRRQLHCFCYRTTTQSIHWFNFVTWHTLSFQTELHRLDFLFWILWVLTTHRVVPRTAELQSEYGSLLVINTRLYPRLTQ